MIHILYGNDIKSKTLHIKKQIENASVVRIPANHLSSEMLFSYSEQNSLFGDEFVIILENPISESEIVFDKEVLERLKDSSTLFIILEDDLLADEVKKYKKYCEVVEKFELEKMTKKEMNPFVIANLFGSRDKIGAWSMYRKLVEKGETAEPIAGMLFWKVKSMLVSGSDKFKDSELKEQSSELVDIYHKGHLGVLDMDIALEQFILKHL